MKKIILGAMFAMLAACSDDSLPAMPQTELEGEWTDQRDGRTYAWVQYGQQQWMTQNMAFHVEGDTVYCNGKSTAAEKLANEQALGRLYSHAQALATVPAQGGWRLPTDADFQQLERYLGMTAAEANATEWRGAIAERMFSYGVLRVVPLNFLLAGYFTEHTTMGNEGSQYRGVQGYYWTATSDDEKEGDYYYYRRFFYNQAGVYRQSMEPTDQKISVRLVRDAASN